MVSPVLKEKFEELFVDEFTKDQYRQWRDENKPLSKRDKELEWLGNIALTVVVAIAISAIGYVIYLASFSRIEQEVREDNFVTYVWKGSKIVRSWYTPVEKLTDSLKTSQRKAGEDFLRILNK